MTYYNTSGSSSDGTGTSTTSTTEVTAQNTIQGVGATSDTSVVISRMQQRRGLKQDLPQPLRPGEFGFTTDSQQLFIGADPAGAPSYNKTSVFEDTLGARTTTQTIVDHQVFQFSLPFKKFAKGEFTGSTQLISWLPTGRKITGSYEPVFSTVFTDSNNVKDIKDNSPFTATDLTIKKNSIELVGNDTATYNTLTSEDYIFNSSSTNGDDAHYITFRTIPQPNEEVTISYMGLEAVNRTLSYVSGSATNTGSIYPGTAFESFYRTYDVPEWDRIPSDLIQYSDTTGTGFLGLEFKHISVRAFGNAISTPNNISLGTLYVHRSGSENSLTVVEGNISRSAANSEVLQVPVGIGTDFSNVGSTSFIVLDAGAFDTGSGASEEIWFDLRPLPIDLVDSGVVYANISLMCDAFRTCTVTANAATNRADVVLHDNVYDGIRLTDYLHFYGADSGVLDGETVLPTYVGTDKIVVAVQPSVYTSLLLTPETAARFSNYGDNLSNAVIQVVNVNHGFTEFNSPNVYVLASADANVIPVADVTPVAMDFTPSLFTDSTFFLPRSGDPTTVDPEIKIIAEELVSYGSVFGYYNGMLAIDLSSATTVGDAIGLISDQNDWPLLQVVPGTDNELLFTQNPAWDSVGQGFTLLEDPNTPTLSALGLTPGDYDLTHTRRAQLETWFDAAVAQPDLPVYNQVNSSLPVDAMYSTTPSSNVSNIGSYVLNIDENFDEIVFDSREEALAFNTVVNNLYFRRNKSDIRGLVNIKSNLELEIKRGLVYGEKTVTYIDTHEADIDENLLQDLVPGLEFNVSQYNAYFIDYTVHDASSVSALTGANYSRVGSIKIIGRTDFDGTGVPDVAFWESGSDIIDDGTNGMSTDAGGNFLTEINTLEFSAEVLAGTNTVAIKCTNNVGIPLKMKYIIRRWNSQGS